MEDDGDDNEENGDDDGKEDGDDDDKLSRDRCKASDLLENHRDTIG